MRRAAPRRAHHLPSRMMKSYHESLVVAIVQSRSVYRAGGDSTSSPLGSLPLSQSQSFSLPPCLTSSSLPGSRNRFQRELNLALTVAFAEPSGVYKAPLLSSPLRPSVAAPSFPARARARARARSRNRDRARREKAPCQIARLRSRHGDPTCEAPSRSQGFQHDSITRRTETLPERSTSEARIKRDGRII